jgi:hypothetical protein
MRRRRNFQLSLTCDWLSNQEEEENCAAVLRLATGSQILRRRRTAQQFFDLRLALKS